MGDAKRWRVIVPALLIFWIIANIDKLGISVIATDSRFLAVMGLTHQPGHIGLLLTAFTLANGLGTFLWGFVIDRLGPRRPAMLASLVWGVAMILGGLSQNFSQLLGTRLLLGLGEGALWPLSHKFLSTAFAPQERGRAGGAWLSGLYLGPAVAAPFMAFLVGSEGWRWCLAASGILSLAVSLPIFAWLVPDPEIALAPPRPRARRFVGQSRYWVNVAAYVMEGVVFFGMGFWLPSYLEHARHLSAHVMGLVSGFTWLVALAAVLLTGFWEDRRHRSDVIGAAAMTVAAIALFAADTATGTVAAVVAIAVGMAAAASATTATQMLLQAETSPRDSARGAGIMVACGSILGGFTATIMGYLVHLEHGAYGAAFAFLVAAAMAGAVLLALLWRRPATQTLAADA